MLAIRTLSVTSGLHAEPITSDHSRDSSQTAAGIVGTACAASIRLITIALVTLLLLMSAIAQAQSTPWPGGRWTPGPVMYGTQTIDTQVTMEDGIRLMARVTYPAIPGSDPVQRAPGSFPVIVQYTPYASTGQPTFFVQRGYIGVTVWARGTNASEGDFSRQGIQERKDGATIVEWASKLEGSNGLVGMIGHSYVGNLALGAAANVKPGSPLKAIAVSGAGLEGFPREIFMRGGAITRTGNAIVPACRGYGRSGNDPTILWCQQLQDEIFAGGPAAFLGQFWAERGVLDDARAIVDNGVAALLYSNWQDITQTAALNTFTAMQNVESAKPRSNTTPGTYDPMDPSLPGRGRYQIIIGEGGHAAMNSNFALLWMDTFLKGQDTGVARMSYPVHLREQTRWINAKTWPLTYEYTPLYLNAEGTLTAEPAASGGSPGTLSFDSFANQPNGSLVYTSAPFPDGATVAGAMAATIYASTSGTNLQLMAAMYSVAPDGTQTFIQDGILVGSQRALDDAKTWRDVNGLVIRPMHQHTADDFLTPNVPYRFDIFLEPRLWPVPPGHSLRLILSSRPPSTACPPGASGLNPAPCYNTAPQLETLTGATFTILADPTYRSSINLPLLPYMHFPTATTDTSPTNWGPEHQMQCGDLDDARLVIGAHITESRFLPRADMNKNGVIDVLDMVDISHQLPKGSKCRGLAVGKGKHDPGG